MSHRPRQLAVAYLGPGDPRPAWLPAPPSWDDMHAQHQAKGAMLEHVDPKVRGEYPGTVACHHSADGRPPVWVAELCRLKPGMTRDDWGAWDVVKKWRHASAVELLRLVQTDPPAGLEGAEA